MKTQKVLLVSDDTPVIRTFEKLLKESWGYDPVIVGNAHEAVLALRADDEIKIALVDHILPGTDGIVLTPMLLGIRSDLVIFMFTDIDLTL